MALSLTELIEREKSNYIRSWVVLGLIGLVMIFDVLTEGYVGATLGVGVLLAVLVPTVALRSYRMIVVWEVLAVALAALVVRELLRYQPVELFGNYIVIAAISLIVAAELYLYTPIEMNRRFAVLLVALLTMTVATLWNLGQWLFDLAVGTGFLDSNYQLMIELIVATAAGLVGGVFFMLYLKQASAEGRHPSVSESPTKRKPQNQQSVPAEGRRVSQLAARLPVPEAYQRIGVRLLQLSMAALAGYGAVIADFGLVLTGLIALGITFLPSLIQGRYNVPMGVGLTLWITLGVFLHTLGTAFFYGESFWFHNLAHGVSGSLIAGIGYATFRAIDEHSTSVRFPPRFMFVLIVIFVVSAGVAWEIMEFVTDELFVAGDGEGLVFVQYGLADTLTDLLFAVIGSIVVGIWGTNSLLGVAAGVREQMDDS